MSHIPNRYGGSFKVLQGQHQFSPSGFALDSNTPFHLQPRQFDKFTKQSNKGFLTRHESSPSVRSGYRKRFFFSNNYTAVYH